MGETVGSAVTMALQEETHRHHIENISRRRFVQGVGVSSSMFLAPFRLGSTTQNWLGKSQYAADPTFNGLIDDFRIYRGSIYAEQVRSLMTT